MLGYRKVYKINGRLVVADDIKSAIDTFNEYLPYTDIKNVILITGDDYLVTNALIKED